jgi:hypothetical protein
MSLFDVLRYPISDPPTVEQLEALPRRVFVKWRRKANFSVSASSQMICHWYGSTNRDLHMFPPKEELQLLRDMIMRMRK